MDIQLLEKIGKHMFGREWKKPTAGMLSLSERQISRWTNEGHAFNNSLRDGRFVADILLPELKRHSVDTQILIEKLEQTANGKRLDAKTHRL